MMDEEVFTHQETADIINKDFVSYKVDAEKNNGPIISFNYDVTKYPTLLFLDSKGRVLERKDGAVYHRELLTLAKNALDQVTIGD
jgi:thioredoxin-related protein